MEKENKKCQFCAEEIKKEAVLCKHCNKKQKEEITKTGKILVGIFAAIFLVFLIGLATDGGGSSSSSSPVATPTEDKITDSRAFIMSKDYIIPVLKSPSTADFPKYDYEFSDLGNNKYTIYSYVDSQNSFGAMIRSNYSVTLSYNGGSWNKSDSWTLHKIVLDNETIYP